jgi:hypothetical protein
MPFRHRIMVGAARSDNVQPDRDEAISSLLNR